MGEKAVPSLRRRVKRSCPSCGPELGGEEKKGRGNPISVQLFPPELVEHIISFLPVRDVVALGQTCHYFHEVCDAEGVWRRICRKLSPRLREQGSGVRPWKRAAILNCTPSPEPVLPFASDLPYSGISPAPESFLMTSAFPANLPGPLSVEADVRFKHAIEYFKSLEPPSDRCPTQSPHY